MTQRQVLEHEVRVLCGEMVSELRIVSEGVNPLTQAAMRALCIELEHELAQLERLSDQLP